MCPRYEGKPTVAGLIVLAVLLSAGLWLQQRRDARQHLVRHTVDDQGRQPREHDSRKIIYVTSSRP
jgi:hypothetical protein